MHLKPRQYYVDLYDRFTVDECRRFERSCREFKSKEGEKSSAKEIARAAALACECGLYFLKGARYEKKEETIQGWMKRDERRDELLQFTSAPKGISCLSCGQAMSVSLKELDGDNYDRVLFMFKCPSGHLPHRAFYDDGTEWKRQKPSCPTCKHPMVEASVRKDRSIQTTISCTHCDHTDTTVLDLDTKEEALVDPDFVQDRERFCLSDEDGQEFIRSQADFKYVQAALDEIKKKEQNKELYEKMEKVRKLKIIEVEQLLMPILAKEGFVKFQMKDPTITKDVVVPFVVHDGKAGREEKESCRELKRIIIDILMDTNWRLMGELQYRLGMLEGRLKACEREEDLIEIAKDVF